MAHPPVCDKFCAKCHFFSDRKAVYYGASVLAVTVNNYTQTVSTGTIDIINSLTLQRCTWKIPVSHSRYQHEQGGGGGYRTGFSHQSRSFHEPGMMPDNANQHLSEPQIRPTSNSSKSTTTTQKLKTFCKSLYFMVV